MGQRQERGPVIHEPSYIERQAGTIIASFRQGDYDVIPAVMEQVYLNLAEDGTFDLAWAMSCKAAAIVSDLRTARARVCDQFSDVALSMGHTAGWAFDILQSAAVGDQARARRFFNLIADDPSALAMGMVMLMHVTIRMILADDRYDASHGDSAE